MTGHKLSIIFWPNKLFNVCLCVYLPVYLSDGLSIYLSVSLPGEG